MRRCACGGSGTARCRCPRRTWGRSRFSQQDFDAEREAAKTVDAEIAAVESLAKEFDLKVAAVWPRCSPNDADNYWLEDGKRTLGKAILKYANGDMVTTKFPSIFEVYLNVPQAEVNGRPFPRDLGMGHAVAVKRLEPADAGVVYHYYDPNAGVYEIAGPALESFIDTVYQCYKDFYNKSNTLTHFRTALEIMRQRRDELTAEAAEAMPRLEEFSQPLREVEDRGEELKLKADASLHLIRTYAIQKP